MSIQDTTIALIIEHGLTVRQIPFSVTTRWSFRPNKELYDGEKIVEIKGRKFVERTRVPVNAGRWMAKKCNHTDSSIRWDMKEDNLSDTLQEAVLKASQQPD
jgi:hypothetical protein